MKTSTVLFPNTVSNTHKELLKLLWKLTIQFNEQRMVRGTTYTYPLYVTQPIKMYIEQKGYLKAVHVKWIPLFQLENAMLSAQLLFFFNPEFSYSLYYSVS